MGTTIISNPPYNMKWTPPPFAQIQARFVDYDVPPASNANFAFILTALDSATDRSVLLLPCSVLRGGTKEEIAIRNLLVENNLIETVILCPDHMFESTQIATSIIVLDKNRKTAMIEMVDLRNKFKEEIREQNGQSGKTNTKRTYKKCIKVIPEEVMDEVLTAISEKSNIPGFCKSISIENLKESEYNLSPGHYIDMVEIETNHRSYADIVNDINRVVNEKNACKLTINEPLAKTLGFDIELYKQDQKRDDGLNELLNKLGAETLIRHDYFTASKGKNVIKFENNSKDILSSILIMIMNNWKQHIYYLNQEENRYLAELRDALLPELISGKIEV